MSSEQGDTCHDLLHRGVPQGGVLSLALLNIPLLSISGDVPESETISMYANHVSIWMSARSPETIISLLQMTVNTNSQYPRTCGLSLFTSKSAPFYLLEKERSYIEFLWTET